MGIEQWSTTPGSNVNANTGINWDEGQAPSTVNNSARDTMAAVREWYEDAQWIKLGENGSATAYSISFVSTTVFKFVGTDRRTLAPTGTRIKAGVGAGNIFGTVATCSLSASDTQIAVAWDSGQLDASLSSVSVGILSAASDSIPRASAFVDNAICDVRITLTTALPVTTGDVTAATNFYVTPCKGNRVALYNGSRWGIYTFTEITTAVPATSSTVYDVFLYPSTAGTAAVETVAWTDATNRATALTKQDGVYAKTGDTTRRYIGTFCTMFGGTAGQTEDSYAKRYVWNYYNRVERPLKVVEATNSWAYSTGAFRQYNNSTANQVDLVRGVSEDLIYIEGRGLASNDAGAFTVVGIGIDATNANSATITLPAHAAASAFGASVAIYNDFQGAGRHFFALLEYSQASGNTTWYGDNGNAALHQSGISGKILG